MEICTINSLEKKHQNEVTNLVHLNVLLSLGVVTRKIRDSCWDYVVNEKSELRLKISVNLLIFIFFVDSKGLSVLQVFVTVLSICLPQLLFLVSNGSRRSAKVYSMLPHNK